MLHYKCLHITKWWNSADRRYRENCSCARVLVFVLIRIMCCWVWVELGFSPNSQPTNTIISADFRARPCSAQCVLIFFVFFNQEGDFSFFSPLPLPRYHDTTCGDKNVGLLLLLSGTGFFLGVLESLFFFAFVQIYLNLNLIGDIPSSVGVSLALCFVGGHIPRLRDKKLPRSAPLAVHVPPSFFYVTG